MEKIALNETLSLSRLIYGMWRLGDDANTSPAHIQAKIEACLAQGITTMDQADIYGGYEAEELLGHAFAAAPSLRDQLDSGHLPSARPTLLPPPLRRPTVGDRAHSARRRRCRR